MLGGLAAGLGLAWLAHSLGLGAAFGEFLLMGLLALVLMWVVGLWLRRKTPATRQTFAYQAVGPESAALAPQYNPQHVGNDASARPWEGQAHFDAAAHTSASSPLGQTSPWGIPSGFDASGFVAAAKSHFITLQDAWDRSDIQALRAMMTDEMLDEIRQQLSEREAHTGGQANKTEVVVLEAQLLGIEDLGSGHMASVEFSGLIKEDQSAGPSPFREVWNMTRAKDSADGWLVAGVQALQ
jgi:predicted lipid-binding transport protein (Tim44 family)